METYSKLLGDLDTEPGKEAQEILNHTIRWSESLYDKSQEYIENMIASQGEDCNQILYIEYHYYQIGLTREWLKKLSAKINDTITVRRELLLQRLHGSSLSPFSQEDIIYIHESERLPIDELWLMEFYKFDIYTKLNPKIPYIVGVDCSTGTDGDNNAITILDPYKVEPVAEFECSYIGETKFEKLLIALTEVLPKAVLCIERNSVGDGILDHLYNSDHRDRLYFDKSRDLVEEGIRDNSTVESMLKHEAKKKLFYGVWTGTESRKDMMAILARHVSEYKDKFITRNIIRDIGSLIRLKSGKIAAAPGFHDDSIMSYLIALYVYYHGNNLALFGILKDQTDLPFDNSGMRSADEINPQYVDQKLIDAARKREKLEKKASWDDMLAKALKDSQRESFQMQKAGLVNHTVYDNTSGDVLTDMEPVGSIDLDIFNGLNGF